MNPRLQVEHTITESISLTDLVRIQLLVVQGASLSEAGLPQNLPSPEHPPLLFSIQLRVTAENVDSDWSLSIGKIQSFHFPTGNGVRVDTHLVNGYQTNVGSDFDSLIAKIIVTASSWDATGRKAQRALEDTQIVGIKTNLDVLRGIVSHPDFLAGQCNTQWLEQNQQDLLQQGRHISQRKAGRDIFPTQSSSGTSTVTAGAGGAVLLRRGDAWSVEMSSLNKQDSTTYHSPGHLKLTRVLRNEFPSSLAAEITFTLPASSTNPHPTPSPYSLTLTSTTASASAVTSSHRRGNPADPNHITIPFPGKLVEVMVDEGDVIREGEVVCVVQQMKMELEVRAKRGGMVSWVLEAEVGEDVAEGTLACIVEGDEIKPSARL